MFFCKERSNQKRIKLLLFFLALTAFLFLKVVPKLALLKERYDYSFWERKYQNSGWVNPYSKEGLSDDVLYVYQGISILKGADLSLLNPEITPLGKYILGGATAIFDNRFFVSLLFYFLSFLAFLYLSQTILKNQPLSFLITLLVFSESVIAQQLGSSSIDLVLLFFLLILLITARNSFHRSFKKRLVPALVLGIFFSVKSYFLGFIVLFSIVVSLCFENERLKKMKNYLFTLPISLVIYCLSYLPYFLKGKDFIDLMRLHKWVIWFYSHRLEKIFYGGPIWLMFFNRWQTWFGKWYGLYNFEKIQEWWFAWPLLLAIFLYSLGLYLSRRNQFSKQDLSYRLVYIWALLYFIFLSLIPIWPRYLIVLLPFLYLIALKELPIIRLRPAFIFHIFKVSAILVFSSILLLLFSKITLVNEVIAQTSLNARNFVFFYNHKASISQILQGVIFSPSYIIGNGRLEYFLFYHHWLIIVLFVVIYFSKKKVLRLGLLVFLLYLLTIMARFYFTPKTDVKKLLQLVAVCYENSKDEEFNYLVYPEKSYDLVNYLFDDYGYKYWGFRPADGRKANRKRTYQFCLGTNTDCPKIELEETIYLFERKLDDNLVLRAYEKIHRY